MLCADKSLEKRRRVECVSALGAQVGNRRIVGPRAHVRLDNLQVTTYIDTPGVGVLDPTRAKGIVVVSGAGIR